MGLKLFFVLAVLAGTQAGPIQEVAIGNQCSRTCTVSNQFNYEPGTTYEYTYDNEIRTTIQGASEDHAGFHLSATVALEFISKCEAVMRVTDVTLKEHDPETSKMKVTSALLGKMLEENPVKISYQDGNIEELCLSAPEIPQVVNIKKGILSAFQISMADINTDETVTEEDVSGKCLTNYTSSDSGWYKKDIIKRKNLLGCTDRHDYKSSVQGIPYSSNSKVQTLPLVKSTHECTHQVVKATGRLTKVMCQEKHTLAPFSRNGNGAVTHNTQKLSYVKEYRARSKPVPVNSRTTLKFDHANGNNAEPTVKDLESKLMDICSTTKQGIKPETPSLFKSLINIMKNMDARSMSAVYKKIKSKTICSANNERVRNFFLDAIPLTGTTDGLSIMVDMLQDNEVTGLQAEMWLTTLSFIQEPTMDMLTTVKPLLYLKQNTEKAMLAVSSLVHSLCRNNMECENSLPVRKIIAVLEAKVGNCKVSKTNFNTVLYALRAIGNAGFGTSAIPTLAKCIKISSNPIEIRLSAIEAFHRIPCTANKQPILSVFLDKDEDSEVRIAAYKALMACPSIDILAQVKNTLATEEVNQVGSYIWSHLTNLMETSDPHKQSIRAIIEDERLQKEFNLDNRKFSRNYEKSLFVEKLNTGVIGEGDLIWSSKSFIPRSAMVNLTVDLFGNAVNLFEIGGRVEGLEFFLESYFGPNGYFSEQDVKTAATEKAVDVIKADKSSRITKRMNSVMDELRGSMYVKVFGNELRYMNFQGLDSLMFGNNFNILDMITKLSKESSYQFTHSTTFLDSSIIIPTSSGFPMNLTVNGTTTIDLQASGKFDVMKMAQKNPNMDIHGIIRPSSAVEVASSMSVDAFVTKIGIKMVSTLHSRTSVQGKISLNEEKALNVEFDLPEDQMDIFSVKSSFFTVHRDLEREQKMITENRKDKKACSGSTLAKITGLELCAEVSFPNASLVENSPYFPMTGPVNVGVSLLKRDSLTGYRIQAKSTHTRNENIVRLAFSTPGSKIDRTFTVDFNLNKVDNTFESSFSSPWKRADFRGTVTNTKALKEIHGKFNWDGSIPYELKASLASEKSGPGMVYSPSVSMRIPKRSPIEMTGSIKYAPWKLFDTEITFTGIKQSPIKFETTLMNKAKLVKAGLSLQLDKKQVYTADASVQKILYKKKVNYKPLISIRTPAREVFAFGGSFIHTFGKNLEIQATLDKVVSQPVILKAKVIKKEYRRNRDLYNIKLDLRSKPMDIKLKSKLDNRNMKTIATDIDLTYIIRRVARDNIKLVSKIINLSSDSLTKAKLSLNLASKRNPDYNFKMLGNIDHNKKHSEFDTDIFYGPNFKDASKQISLSAAFDRALKSWKQSSLKFNGQFRKGNDIKVVGKVNHAHTKTTLDNTMTFRLNGEGVSSTLKLKDASKALKNLQGNLELSIPGKTLTVSQAIVEEKPNKFTSTMEAQFGKAKNNVITRWEKYSPRSLTLSSEWNLAGMDPIYIATEYSLSTSLYKIHASFSNGKFNYSGSSSAEFPDQQTMQISADLECPTRRVVAFVEGKKEGQRLSTQADLRWNADRDDSKRVIISGNLLSPTMKNIDGSVAIQHPAITLGVNLKHSVGSKYVSKLEVEKDNSQLFLIDTTFGIYTQKAGKEVVGTIDMKTPFKNLKSLNIKMNQAIEDAKYETKLDVKWNPKNVMSSTFTVKRPLSTNLINVELVAKTPFRAVRTVHVSLVNKINKGMFTVAKLNWNKQSVQIDVTLANKGNDRKTDLQGQIDLKTSYRNMKDGTIKLTHFSERGTYKSEAVMRMNKKQYSIENTMRHRMNGWNVNNNGKLTISMPGDQITTTWDHKNTLNEVTTSSEMIWGTKGASVKYSAIQDFKIGSGRLSSALELQLPFNNFRDIVFQINHEHKPGHIASNLKLESDRNSLAFADAKYLLENGEVKSSLSMSNPLYDGDVSVTLTSVYARYPMTGHFELTLSPLQTTTVDASFNKDQRGNADVSLTLTAPAFEPLTITGRRAVKYSGIESSVSIEYAPSKVVSFETVHKLGRQKNLKMKFTSPFTEVYSSEMTLSVLSNSLKSFVSIEAEPFIPKVSAEITGENNNGLNGNMKFTTRSSYSQASISSELENGERKSTAIVEYQPGKIVKLTSSYKLDSVYDLSMSFELTTPFQSLPYSSVNLQHRGDLREFSNKVEFEYIRGEKMSGASTFSTRNGYEGTISLTTPFIEETVEGGFSHTGSWNDFNTHVEVSKGTKYTADLSHKGNLKDFNSELKLSDGTYDMKGTAKFAREPKLNADVVIETPIKNWEEMRLIYTLDGDLFKFTQEAEVRITKYGTFKADTSVDLQNSVAFSLNMKTPIKGYNNMAASLSHSGSFGRFESRANVRNGQKIFEGIVKFNSNPAYNLDISVRTPIEGFRQSRVSITFEGELKSFKSNFEFQLNKQVSEVDLSFSFKRKLDVDLTIRTPYMEPVKASIDHWGKWNKFTSKLRVRAGKAKIISDVRFQINPSFVTFVSLKTPFRLFKNHQFSLKHAGNRNSFKCNLDYKCNNLNYNGDITFQNLNTMKCEVNLKGSDFKPIKATVSHDGPVHNFKSSGEISIGKKVANIGVSVKSVDGLKTSVQLQTPIKGYESMDASYVHTGPLTNFKCHGEAALNKKRSQFDLTFDISRDVAVSLTFKTPFDDFKDLSSSFTHAGSLRNFNTAVLFAKNEKRLEGVFMFSNMKKIMSTASVRSMFPQISNIEMAFDHDGTMKAFKTHGEVKFGQQKSQADISFDSTNGYSGEASVVTPYTSMATSFDHVSTDSSTTSNADFTVDGIKKYNLRSVIATKPSLSASVHVVTPIKGYENTEFTMNHDGSAANFRSQMSLVFLGERGEVEVTFEKASNMQCRFIASSSLFKRVEITMSHAGVPTNFKSAIECRYGRKSQLLTEAALNVEGPFTGTFKMVSPHMRNVKASFNHQGGIKNFNSAAQVVYAGKTSTVGVVFKFDRDLEGTFTVNSPVTKELKIAVTSYGPVENARTSFQVLYGGDSMVTLKSEWNFLSSMKAEVNMQTQVEGFRQMVAKFDHTGEMNNFETDAELSMESKAVRANVQFSPSKGKLVINAPFMKDVEVQYTFVGQLPTHAIETKMNYGSREVLHMTSSLSSTRNSMEGGLSIETSVTIPIATTFKVTGKSLDRFSCEMSVMVDNERHEADMSFNTIAYKAGSISIRSPYMVPVSASVALKGSMREQLSLEGNVNIDSERHEVEITFQKDGETDANFSLRSPLTVPINAKFNMKANLPSSFEASAWLTIDSVNHEMDMSFNRIGETGGTFNLKSPAMIPVSMSFNVNGDLNRFIANVEAKIHSELNRADISFNRNNGIEGSFGLTSPFVMPINGQVTISGIPRNFRSNGKLTLGSDSFEGDMAFTNDKIIKGSISLTPLIYCGNVVASFEHDGSLTNFRSHAELSSDDTKLLNTDVAFNIETALKGSAVVSFKDMTGSGSFEHTGTWSSFRNVMSMEFNSESLLDSTVTFKSQPITFDFTVKVPIEGLEMISGQFEHTGDMLNFKNHAELNIAGDKTETEMTCNFASKLEARISANSPYFPSTSAGFDVESSSGLKANVDFNLGTMKYAIESSVFTRGGLDAEVTIISPIQGYKKIVTTITHKGKFPEMNTVFNLRTGRRTLAASTLTLSLKNGLTARFSAQSVFMPMVQLSLDHKGNIENFNSNAELRINGEPYTTVVTFKKQPKPEGSLSISTPYTKDISGTLNLDLEVPSAEFTTMYGEKSLSGFATTLQGRNEIGAKVGIKTPFRGFEDVNGFVKYVKAYKSATLNAEMDMGPSRKYEFETTSKWSRGASGKITLKTPYSKFTHSSADFRIDGTFPFGKSEVNVFHAGDKFTFTSNLKQEKSITAEVMISTPISGFESMGATFSHQGPFSDMITRAKVMFPANENIDFSFTNKMKNNRQETKATLETPYIEDLSFELDFNGMPTDFKNTVVMSMGTTHSIKYQTDLKLDSFKLDFDTTFTTIISGTSDEQKATVKYSIGENSEASAYVKIFGSVFSLDSSLELAENINGMISLKTPLPNVQDVGLTFSHTGDYRRFTSKATIQYAQGKVIESTVEYVKFGWRRLQTSVDIQTPFNDFENTKLSYTHSASVDSFECDASLSVMNSDFNGNLKASRSPMSVTLRINTPFESFEQIGGDMKMDYGSIFFNGDASVTYMKDNTISVISRMDMNSSPKSLSLRMTTPFRNFRYADLSFTHSGGLSGFQSVASISAPYLRTLRAEAEGSVSSLATLSGTVTVTTEIKNFENLKFSIRNSVIRAKVNSRIEATWSPYKSIVFDGSFKDTKTSMGADVTVFTPFESFRRYSLKAETSIRDNQYSQSLFSKLNGNTQADIDLTLDLGTLKSAALTMKAPMAIETSLQGQRTYNKYTGSAVVSVNRMTVKVDSSFDTVSKEFTAVYQCPENKIELDSAFSLLHPKADLTVNGERYGYDFLLEKSDARMKVILPSRSLLVSGSQRYRTTEGSFMWDADKDDTKKVGFRSVMSSTKDSVKADVTLMMPTLGKDVQLDSEMILNRGRIIFDGKTELSYSQDRRKKFTITSKLADVSNEWSSKNYTFSLGISHPYTSIGVQVNSHLGRSNSKYTGGIDVEYLTVNRETKTFSVNGELNKLRKTVNFEMNSPVKTVAVSGSANTESPFIFSLQNKYDNKRPLTTRMSVDPRAKSFSFQMNYDLDNPNNEFQINAKYINSTAVFAEMFHVVNRQKVSDALITLRLNNSHLLHSRLHWRPSMMNEFRELVNRKSTAYKKQISNFVRVVSNDVDYEMFQKYQLIISEIANELDLEALQDMYDTNQYHVRDVTDTVVATLADMKMVARDASDKMMKSIPDMGVIRLSKQMAQMVADNYNNGLVYVSDSANSIINSGILKNVSKGVNDLDFQRYNEYMNYVYNVRSIPEKFVTKRYAPAMEDAMVYINSKVDGKVMQQGKNAYKYWEVKENTQMIIDAIVDWIREEIEEEISDIKATLLNLKKTTVTVYDPKHGEIQVELHLPFPVKSLESLPIVDITPFWTKCKSYTPSMPSISLPSADVTSWIPPFDGYATIQGDRITTFDGLTYDLGKTCTFLLARDFVNGNFSAVLNNDENGKSVILLTRGMSIEIKSNGTVLVNGAPFRPAQTFGNGISIQSNGEGHVTVNAPGIFEMTYNKDFDLYSFKMNGWYYGKVGGLFGTYDNEPTNDLMTSYGKQINNANRFASTWDVGTARCR